MYRRVISAILALGLGTLAPVPSLCAILANLSGDCAPAPAQSECAQMQMAAPQAELRAGMSLACCQVSKPPLPKSSAGLTTLDARAEALLPRQASSSMQPVQFVRAPLTHALSPPGRQPLLCVFLI